MLTSWQIAQMHGQQAQAFGQQQALGQQISSRMPMPYQGLGATGMQHGFGQGIGYNYGGAFGSGYGPGNSFGNTMTSAIGGIGHAVGGGMGIAGGVGGFMMGGIGGAIGGFMGGSVLGAGIKHVAGSFMEGAHEQSALERTLSQFQFQNAASRTGRGFSRSDSMQIGNMVRQIERMPEMLTSFGELNRLMDKMGQMGLMQGVKDAGEFMRKFRDTTNTLRDMAKMMGTTMEGALQAFGEARMSGFYNKMDISKNVLQRQVVAGVSGMNQGQIGGLQMYGAELAHSLGGSRAGGARNMLRTAGQLGMANQMGILSNDMIMEMTGKEGAEGIQELSGMMGQLSYRMGRSNVGQALTLALGKVENGRYTGEMDQELVERVRRGELSLSELKSMARRKASTRGAKLSFAAHKNRLRTEMAGAVGSEGIAMQLQEILGDRGWDNPDATNLVMQRFGASEEQANLLQQLMPNLQSIGSQMGIAGKQEVRNSARNAGMATHGWDAIKHRIGKKIQHVTTDWAKDLGTGVRDYFQNWADEFMDDLTGQYREYVTKRVADTVKFSMGGSATNRASLQRMSERAQRFTQNSSGLVGAGRLDVGGLSQEAGGAFQLSKEIGARVGHWLGGGQTAGERAVDVLGGLDKGLFLERGQVSDLKEQGATVLDSSYWTRSGVGITASGARGAQRRLTQLNTDAGGMREWNRVLAAAGTGKTRDPEAALREAYQMAMQRGDVQLESDPAKKADMVWKEMRKHLPADTLRNLEKSDLGRLNIMAGVQAAERKAGNVYAGGIDFEGLGRGTLGGIDLKNQAAIGRAIEGMDKKLGKALSGSETTASWAEVKKMLDEGSQMGTLLTGNDKYRGLLGGGKSRGGKYADASGMTVRNIAAKDPSDWTEQDKAVLKEMGVDASKLAAEINKNPEAWKRLQSAAQSGKLSEDDITKYLTMTEASGLNKITSEMNRQGSELANRLKGDNYKAAQEAIRKAGGGDVLDMLNKQAKDLEGVNLTNIGSYTDATADIAGRIAGIKDKDARAAALELGGDEVRSAYAYRQGTKKRLRRGMGVDQVLKAGGLDLGFSDADMAFKKDLEGLLGKDGKLDKGEMDAVLKMLGGQQAGGLRARAGTEANSAYMSEQEVANNLKSLSENNLKATQILANLAAGKTGKDAMEGVK